MPIGYPPQQRHAADPATEKRLIAIAMQRKGAALQPVKTDRPLGIHRQYNPCRHLEIRRFTLTGPIAIDRPHHGIRPAQRLLQTGARPPPQIIEPKRSLLSHGLESRHPDHPKSWTATPQPPPTTHNHFQYMRTNLWRCSLGAALQCAQHLSQGFRGLRSTRPLSRRTKSTSARAITCC